MHREKTALCCHERSPLCSLCLRCPASAHFSLKWHEIESDGPTLLSWPSTDKEFSLIGQTSLIEDVELGSQPTFFHYLGDWLRRKAKRSTPPKGKGEDFSWKQTNSLTKESNLRRVTDMEREGKVCESVRNCMSKPKRNLGPDCILSIP